MNWENLCLNLSFAVESKMGNYARLSHFKFNMTNETFDILKFQQFANELGELCFPLGKKEF